MARFLANFSGQIHSTAPGANLPTFVCSSPVYGLQQVGHRPEVRRLSVSIQICQFLGDENPVRFLLYALSL